MTRKPRTLMVLGGSNWQTYMVEQAHQMGFRTVVIDRNEAPPASFVADAFYPVDFSHVGEAIEVARREKVDGVATFGTNDAIVTVARIKEALGLPSDCIPADVALRVVYKHTMREDLAAAGVPIPAGRQLSGDDCRAEAERFFNDLRAPILLKPSDNSGGKGITIVRGEEQIPAAVESAMRAARNGRVLAEEFVEGTVLGVESITQGGRVIPIAIADKVMGPPPYCVTLGVIAPSALPEDVQRRVYEVNEATIRALKIDTAPTHIDMVVDGDGTPKVIDVGPRLAGGPIVFEIIRRVMWVDMMAYVIRSAFGEIGPVEPRWTGLYAGSRHFTAGRSGVVESLSCPDDVLKRCRSTYLRFWKKPGDVVLPATNDTHPIGFVVCLGDTFRKAQDNLEAVAAGVELVMRPAGGGS